MKFIQRLGLWYPHAVLTVLETIQVPTLGESKWISANLKQDRSLVPPHHTGLTHGSRTMSQPDRHPILSVQSLPAGQTSLNFRCFSEG